MMNGYIITALLSFIIINSQVTAGNFEFIDSGKTVYKDTIDNIFYDKGILLDISYPNNWEFRNTLTETKDTSYKLIEISSGLMPGGYRFFILITTDDMHYFNKNLLNETFSMNDTSIAAMITPYSMNDLEHLSRYYYLSKKHDTLNNIIVFTQYDSYKAMEKYSGAVENLIKKIKIIPITEK